MKLNLMAFIVGVLALASCKEGNQQLSVRQLQKNDKSTRWEIQINQPEFSSNVVNRHENCKVFNTFISYMVQRMQTNFIQKANEELVAMDSANVKQRAPFVLQVDNNVLMSGPRIMSVRLTCYQMFDEAHGMTDFYGLNYDMREQVFLSKGDILDLNKSDEINALLEKHLVDPDSVLTFAKPTVKNVTSVNLTPAGIEFVYAQYILGPYSYGPVTISVPYEELKEVILLKK